MLILGAGGFAKEIVEDIQGIANMSEIAFFDDTEKGKSKHFLGSYPILHTVEDVAKFFNKFGNSFVLGIGDPYLREKMLNDFEQLGGKVVSSFSNCACIGTVNVTIEKGTNVLHHAVISNDVRIGLGGLIYFHTAITHDCELGNYVTVSPGAKILGKAKIGDYCQIGANATVLPNIELGENVIVGAGAVVTKNVKSNCVVAGVPAVPLKK